MHEDEHGPDFVYHYTSIDTLLKICKSRQIWATSIRYLNDTSERELFLRRVEERMPALLARLINHHPDEDEDITLGDVRNIASNAQKRHTSGPFVASFSAHDDSLPQWRAYCPNGNGVSIGFRVEALRRVPAPGRAGGRPVTFRRVRYLQPRTTEDLDDAVLAAYGRAETSPERFYEHPHLPSWSLGTEFARKLEEEATVYKDHSFSHEYEYRLIVDSFFRDYELLSFRATRSSLIPFVTLSVPSTDDSSPTWDAVASVRLGPNANADLTAEAVDAFLKSQRVNATVLMSEIPFRDWL